MIIRALSNYWLKENATRIFWIVFALQFICWTVIPALTQHNAPLDVIEGFAWGREWPLGTYKHPPLQAWLLEIAYQLLGTSPFGYFGLSALCSAVTLWAVYSTGRLLSGKRHGLIAAMLAQTILYLNFLMPEFNPNVLQLVCWALGAYAFSHAVVRQKAKYWLLVGVIFAAGFYAKYTMGILALSFGLFLLLHPEARKNLLTPWPYIAVVLTAALLAPHMQWLFEHHFLPFSYAAERAEPAKTLGQHVLFPLRFALSQLACLAPAFIAGAVLLLPLKKDAQENGLKSALIGWLAFAPLGIVLTASLLSGEKLRDMWGMPFLSFIPLWLVTRFEIQPRLKEFALTWIGLLAFSLLAFAGNQLAASMLGFKPLRGHFPGHELSDAVFSKWHETEPGSLHTIIGDAWLAGNVAFYAKDQKRPHVWIDGGSQTSQWIDPQKVKSDGAMLVWKGEPPTWLQNFPDAKIIDPLTLKWHAATKYPDLEIGLAVLPPAINVP